MECPVLLAMFHEVGAGHTDSQKFVELYTLMIRIHFSCYTLSPLLGSLPKLLNNKAFMSQELRKPFCETHPRLLKTVEEREMTQEPWTCLGQVLDESCPLSRLHLLL